MQETASGEALLKQLILTSGDCAKLMPDGSPDEVSSCTRFAVSSAIWHSSRSRHLETLSLHGLAPPGRDIIYACARTSSRSETGTWEIRKDLIVNR